MATTNQFTMGAMYDFTTHAPAVLGAFRSVKVTGIVDYRGAQQYIDPAARHANVYGSLPANTAPDDHTRYYYLVVVQTNGSTTALGLPWIVSDSVQLKERGRISVSIEDTGPEDMANIKRALISNGFTVGKIELAN
jgi:hypothetical protein